MNMHPTFHSFWQELKSQKLSFFAFIFLMCLLGISLSLPFIINEQTANDVNLNLKLIPPNATYWCGTDELGRNLFLRLLFGARLAFLYIAIVPLFAAVIGGLIGIVAGYMGGIVDRILMRLTDIALSLPRIVVALALAAILGPSIHNAILALACTSWPTYARLMRTEAAQASQSDCIVFNRLRGIHTLKLIFLHTRKFCMNALITRIFLEMSGVILIAATLSFLGLGAQPPTPEWGTMVSSGRAYFLTHWWTVFFPSLAIVLFSLALNIIGEFIRNYLNPRRAEELCFS